MLVWSCRAENEFGIGQRFESDRFARLLENREDPALQFVRHRHDAGRDCGPKDGVARRWIVKPALAGLQAYREIVDRRRTRDDARYGPVAAEEHARRTGLRHIFRALVEAYRRTQFEFRRQSNPQLKTARPARFVETTAVPHAAPRLHPFNSAGR